MKNVMTIVQKLKSRKFLMALAGLIVGLVVAYGGDSETISQIAGLVTSVASIVSYIIVEGHIDAKAVNDTANVIKEAEELDLED